MISSATRFLFALLLISAFASAQDRDTVKLRIQETRDFILKQRGVPSYRDSIQKSIFAYEKGLRSHCSTIDVQFDSPDVRDRMVALLEVKDGKPVAGGWRESVPGMACNQKRLFSIAVDVTPDGLRFTTLFPGEAAGDIELQKDTLKNIEMDLQMLQGNGRKKCPPEVMDTRLVGAPSTPQDNGLLSKWTESWTVESCGKSYSVPITYTPDSTGTSISVGVTEIKPLP